MLLKAEFEAQMSYLDPSIEAMLTAGEGNQNYYCKDYIKDDDDDDNNDECVVTTPARMLTMR